MSGAGRKVFQPGEVLTASNVQNYLQDQAVQYYAGTAARGSAIGTATTEGMMSYLADTNSVQMATGTATWVNVDSIPIVSGTATRDALYPSPVAGNTVHRSDTGFQETYYSAAGTAAAGWYQGRNGGLVPIIPDSITVGSGSASVSGNGLITVSGVSSVSLNSVFSSNYQNYRVLFTADTAATFSSGAYISIRMRTSTDDNTSVYYWGGQYNFANTVGTGHSYGSGVTQFNSHYINANSTSNHAEMDILNPNNAKNTGLAFQSFGSHPQGTISHFINGTVSTTTQYTGMTFFGTSSGTWGGTIQVFGYRK